VFSLVVLGLSDAFLREAESSGLFFIIFCLLFVILLFVICYYGLFLLVAVDFSHSI
jgi:hypothetical protein